MRMMKTPKGISKDFIFDDFRADHFMHNENLPVENVTWHQAAAFANALSRSENLPCAFEYVGGFIQCVSDYTNSKGYRLPTKRTNKAL